MWAEGQQASAAEPIRGDMRSTTEARHLRAAQRKQGAAREERSDVDEDEEADTAWGECWGVRMSPANPCYVGRGDNICGGEVVYKIPEIKDLLRCHSEDSQRWLTTS